MSPRISPFPDISARLLGTNGFHRFGSMRVEIFSVNFPTLKPAAPLCVRGAQNGPNARGKDDGFGESNGVQAMRARNANGGGDRVV
jgi:hypothetical protein